MIKKVPYNSNLTPIGNAPVYAGKPVYTDGRIVYGWIYPGQRIPAGVADSGGFFAGEDSYSKISIVRTNLSKIERLSGYHGDMWAIPAWATLEYDQYHECGFVHLQQGCYKFDGAVVALGSDGSALIYYNYKLHFMAFGTRRKDSSQRPLFIADIYAYGIGVSYYGTYYSKDDNGVIYVYDDAMTLLCTYDDGMIHAPDYDGEGDIRITAEYPIWDATDTVVNLELLRSLNAQALNPIFVVDGFRQSGQQPVIYNLFYDNGTSDVRKMFQLATPNDCYLTAQTPDRDQDGNVYYTGDYVLHCDIVEADGNSSYITKVGSEITVYENGNVLAYTNGNILAVYNSQGSVIYSGAGWIDLYNLTDTGNVDGSGNVIYSGDYIALRPLSSSPSLGGTAEATINGNNIVIYDNVSGDEIAEQNGNVITVYEDNIEIYDSLGSIATSMEPCEWSCDYTIRRDIRGIGANITSIGGTVTHDSEGWHIDGGTIQLYSGTVLYAEGTGGSVSGSTTGSVTIYDAQGQVEWQGNGWIDTEGLTPTGQDPQGNPTFTGRYTIRRDITGSGLTRGSSGSIVIYNNNHDLVARESQGNVIIYGPSGQVVSTDSGWIDTENRVAVRYAGSYVITCSVDGMNGSNTIITIDGDVYVLESNRQDIVANEDGSGLIVNDNGNEIYNGPGHITTSNLDAQRTIRSYYIDATGITEQQYPQFCQLSEDVKIDLSTMALTIENQTYNNDPFGLLTTQGIVFPGGVHMAKRQNKYYFISQDNNKIFKVVDDNNIIEMQYNLIGNCFNLVWTNKV